MRHIRHVRINPSHWNHSIVLPTPKKREPRRGSWTSRAPINHGDLEGLVLELQNPLVLKTRLRVSLMARRPRRSPVLLLCRG